MTKHYRKASIYFKDESAGILEETESGYVFKYNDNFIRKKISISSSISANKIEHTSKELFPFFVGLLPEGWYLDIVSATLKIDKNDAFGILLATCHDTVGAVSIRKENNYA
jgi:serine/threonine-protein kinase HipA